MNLDQLLEFCSYYNLIKSSTHLPISAPSQLKPPVQKEEKTVRRKIEKVEPKKQVQAEKPIKPKMEFAGRTQKKSVSPIAKDHSSTKQQPKERPKKIEVVQQPKNLTLDYFINHISTQPATHTAYKHSSSPDYTKNYQTFGRTIKQDNYYQTYEDKVNKNKGNQTDRNEKKNYDITSFTIKPQGYSQSYNGQPYTQPYNYNQPQPVRTNSQNYGFSQSYNPSQFNNQYGNFSVTNPQMQKPMWEKPSFDKKSAFVLQLDNSKQDSMLLYSPTPSRRDNGSYGTSSFLRNVSPDRSLSKSRTQHKRKNSQRPFYDPTQLTPPRTDRDSEMRQRQPSEVILSKSILQLPENSCYPTKKQTEYQNRRETSNTNIKNRKARQVVLDDQCEEYLVAALGKAPVAIDMGKASH